MNAITIAKLAAGIVTLTAVSLMASILKFGVLTASWPQPLLAIGDGIFFVSLIVSLVWSTGIARSLRKGWLPTASLAMAFGAGVLLATGLLVEATFRPLWGMLPLPSMPSIGYERDGIWLLNKATQCLLLSLPFAAWRAVQNRSQLLADSASLTSTT